MYEGRKKTLQFDHSSGSVSRGYKSLQLIIKYSCDTAGANTQSHLLISFLHHCVWFLSPNRKQGSVSPVPVSPGTKSEKKCTPCCLRHKRSIKRVGWPRSLANRKQPSNLQQKPVCHPVTTFIVTREIISPPVGKFFQIPIWTAGHLSKNVGGPRWLDLRSVRREWSYSHCPCASGSGAFLFI